MIPIEYLDLENVKTEFGSVEKIRSRLKGYINASSVNLILAYDPIAPVDEPQILFLITQSSRVAVWGKLNEMAELITKNNFQDRLASTHERMIE